MKTKKVYILAAAVFAVCLLLPMASNAVTVSPTIIELNAAKGDAISQTLKVRNDSNMAAVYGLSVEKFMAADETGTPQFVSGGEDVDLASWIKFPASSITVPAGATVSVPFTIVVPSYASPGGHYAAVFLNTVPSQTAVTAGSQISVASRIGTLILVKIAGEINESAELTQFSAGNNTYDSLPIDFIVKVNNTGNVHLQPTGTILIKNMFGSVVGETTVNDNGGNILPGQIRQFNAQWIIDPNAVGSTTFWGRYWDEIENYAFGKYTAELDLSYGTAGATLQGATSFWVMPLNISIVNLLIAIVIVIIILIFAMKKHDNRLIKKSTNKNRKKVR